MRWGLNFPGSQLKTPSGYTPAALFQSFVPTLLYSYFGPGYKNQQDKECLSSTSQGPQWSTADYKSKNSKHWRRAFSGEPLQSESSFSLRGGVDLAVRLPPLQPQSLVRLYPHTRVNTRPYMHAQASTRLHMITRSHTHSHTTYASSVHYSNYLVLLVCTTCYFIAPRSQPPSPYSYTSYSSTNHRRNPRPSRPLRSRPLEHQPLAAVSAHSHAHVHMHAHAQVHAHTLTRTLAHARTRSRARTHARTRTHTSTRAHTRTRARALDLVVRLGLGLPLRH